MIEIVTSTPLIDEGQKAEQNPDARRELDRFIGARNKLISLKSNVYGFNPELSYRQKLSLAQRVMYSSWKGLHDLGYPLLANTLLQMDNKENGA